jgi:hypothetical protein
MNAPWRAIAGVAALYVLLAIAFVRVPVAAADFGHDAGSHLSFEFYAQQHYQFGVDVIQNVGPYGYLQYPRDYSGLLPLRKLAFQVAFGLLCAGLTIRARRYFASAVAKVLFIGAIVFAPPSLPGYGDFDPVVYLFLLLAAHHLLTRDRYGSPPLLDAATLLALAVVSLMKTTNLALVGWLMTLVVLQRLRTRRFAGAAGDAATFVIAFLLLWMLAGQHLSNLGAFAYGAFAFTTGYNEMMMAGGLPHEGALLALALGVIGVFAVCNLWRLARGQAGLARIPLTLFEASCLFVVWKHAFVRADHAIYFAHFAVSASALLFLAHEARRTPAESWTARPLPRVAVLAALVLAVSSARLAHGYVGSASAVVAAFGEQPAGVWRALHWSRLRASLDRTLDENRRTVDLPRIRQAVGAATIDEFGFWPGLPLLAGLNYHPRPMPITFAAGSGPLMRRNAAFYRDPSRAPAFILAQLGSADADRFGAQDDALAALEVMRRYEPVLVERGLILLKRRPDPQPDAQFRPISSRPVRWGDEVAVPRLPDGRVWCTVTITPSLRGRVRSFLYKPAPVFVELAFQGQPLMRARFLTSAGPTGFLIQPLVLDNTDLLGTYGAASGGGMPRLDPFQVRVNGRVVSWAPRTLAGRTVDSMRFVTERGDGDNFQDIIQVAFFFVD